MPVRWVPAFQVRLFRNSTPASRRKFLLEESAKHLPSQMTPPLSNGNTRVVTRSFERIRHPDSMPFATKPAVLNSLDGGCLSRLFLSNFLSSSARMEKPEHDVRNLGYNQFIFQMLPST